MFYFIPTKNGIGVELWGSYDDLKVVYETVGKFWNQDGFQERPGFENRDNLLSGFSYEIRKAFQGGRLTRDHSHFTAEPIAHFGCQISWVHLLFSINAIRYNMGFIPSNKLDLGIMLQLEYWFEESVKDFDKLRGSVLIPYLLGKIDRSNPYIYQFMRSINADFFKLGGGKEAFQQLDRLLQVAVKGTREYKAYHSFLQMEAERLKCEISELELEDDHINYEAMVW